VEIHNNVTDPCLLTILEYYKEEDSKFIKKVEAVESLVRILKQKLPRDPKIKRALLLFLAGFQQKELITKEEARQFVMSYSS